MQKVNIRFPIWLTVFIVILFIFLMALTVYHAKGRGLSTPLDREHLTIVFVTSGVILAFVIATLFLTYLRRSRAFLKEEFKRLKEKADWEEKLVREKKTIEGIVEGSPIPTFVVNKEHQVILWNRACAELTGFAARDMIGTDNHYIPFYGDDEKRPLLADLIIDQDMQALEKYYGTKQFKKSDKVEGAYEVRDFYHNLGGRSRHLYFLAAPIYDERGEITAAVETLQDVSVEVEMAEQLKAWQEDLIREKRTIEGIIEGSPIPTFVINNEHRIILWNRACADLTGLGAGEMIGTDRQYIPFYGADRKRPVIADLIIDQDVGGLEKYYSKKKVKKSDIVKGAFEARDFYENLGGKRRNLYFLAAPIYDDKGNVMAAVETLQDVSNEVEMEQNLREYAETLENELTENVNLRKEIESVYNYLHSIVDSSPDTLFDVSADGIINYISRDLVLKDGQGSNHFKGKHFTEFVDPEYREFLQKKWEEAKQGIYKPYELEVRSKDGSRRNMLIHTRPVKGTNRYVFVQRDITDFKELETRFFESQKLAAIGQLSAGIAHEIRNPLSSIKMSLQILEKRMQPAGNDLKRFNIAQREVEHLEDLVNDILIYAKPAEPKRTLTDVRKIVENSLDMAEKFLTDKQIRVQTRFEESLPLLHVDEVMLKQSFLNLYRNAADAMNTGGALMISATLIDGDNRPSISLAIEDNGCGIDEIDMPYIFNPFFTKKSYGTGLGLTQVKKIVDLHQGTIDIASVKGQGTRITLTFPLEEGPPAG